MRIGWNDNGIGKKKKKKWNNKPEDWYWAKAPLLPKFIWPLEESSAKEIKICTGLGSYQRKY